jgi:5'-nucleotidase/UDP-sugar diphosphatase
MKKLLNLKRLLGFIAVLGLLAPQVVAQPNSERQARISVVHTNDVHSNVAVEPYVKGYVDSLRAEKKLVVLVSAGDAFDGTPFATLSKGMDVATVMNMTGYEVFAMGNHEQFVGCWLPKLNSSILLRD